MEVLPERKLDEIRGKMMVGHATPEEMRDFLTYVTKLESLVEEASNVDFWGSEGWHRQMGWDE